MIDNSPEVYVIDEKFGPEPWNIQIVLAEISRMRGDMTHDEFMLMCCQIADKARRGADIPEDPLQLDDDEKARIRKELLESARRDGDQDDRKETA